MKKTLSILFVLVSLTALAQNPKRYNDIKQFDSIYITKNMQTEGNLKLVALDTVNNKISHFNRSCVYKAHIIRSH
jgi:hypothetical protein